MLDASLERQVGHALRLSEVIGARFMASFLDFRAPALLWVQGAAVICSAVGASRLGGCERDMRWLLLAAEALIIEL